MFRLILLLAFIGIAVLAVSIVTQAITRTAPATGNSMPDTFKRISYVLLIVLMFGICTGWLGAV